MKGRLLPAQGIREGLLEQRPLCRALKDGWNAGICIWGGEEKWMVEHVHCAEGNS